MHILKQFLRRIQQAGFSPTFFGTDKDVSEINAVKHVWPQAKHQLCYWHALRAVRTKLKDSSKSKILATYNPREAEKLVPGLEMCWGSVPTRRPDGPHRYQRCECPSSEIRFEETGKAEGLSTQEKKCSNSNKCSVGIFIPTLLFEIRMAYSDLLKIFTNNAQAKCITIARRGVFSRFGHSFSSIGIVMSSGNCGLGLPTRWRSRF